MRNIIFHLYSFRDRRITGENRTRCGKLDRCPDDHDKKHGAGRFLSDFKEKVHEYPREGVRYCRPCKADYDEHGADDL